jgi:hypothetical protein
LKECLDAAAVLEEPIAMSSKTEPSTIEGRFEAESKKVFLVAAIGIWIVVDLVSAQLVPIGTATCRKISNKYHHAVRTSCSCYERYGPYRYPFSRIP